MKQRQAKSEAVRTSGTQGEGFFGLYLFLIYFYFILSWLAQIQSDFTVYKQKHECRLAEKEK